MAEINREMFGKIHELLIEFPELHEQGGWETDPAETGLCGTTRCVAGWAVWLGAQERGLLDKKRQKTGTEIRSDLAYDLGLVEGELDSNWYYGDYEVTAHPVLGGTLLGLDGDQAYSLFHDMDNDRVVARVKSYAETGADLSYEEWSSYES